VAWPTFRKDHGNIIATYSVIIQAVQTES